jgi:hypothetical protein
MASEEPFYDAEQNPRSLRDEEIAEPLDEEYVLGLETELGLLNEELECFITPGWALVADRMRRKETIVTEQLISDEKSDVAYSRAWIQALRELASLPDLCRARRDQVIEELERLRSQGPEEE